jgi:hypothetical protein
MSNSNDALKAKATYWFKLFYVYLEQVYLLLRKNMSQKQVNARSFWKDSIMIQFFTLSFLTLILYQNAGGSDSASEYSYFKLPPLSKQVPWGIFNDLSNGNSEGDDYSNRLYYSPQGHPGVENLITALITEFPDVEVVGAANNAGIDSLYEANIFNTWASLEFFLTPDQLSTGKLIPSESTPTTVSYQIAISPSNWDLSLTTGNYSDSVYNDQFCDADLFWSSGYMTLQNFVATYLAKNYSFVDPNLQIDTFVQRYPKSPIYEDQENINIDTARNSIWKWIGPTILSICLFTPMLTLLTEMVRERQFYMKDLLEISGIMNFSYYSSYYLFAFILGQFSLWFTIGLLNMYGIITDDRVAPYGALLTVYVLASSAFGMAFGFLIPRSEYYGLPVFLTTCALTVCGAYLAIANNITIGLKLFFCFLSPSVGLTMGVIVIESYLFAHGNPMNWHYLNHNKNYPDLYEINVVILISALMYFLIVLSMPLDWVWKLFSLSDSNEPGNEKPQQQDELTYPCDAEAEDATDSNVSNSVLLNAESLTQIYPDGTHAVKDMSFRVKQGEVLSFLGANGAGKSTTMKMLCGTLQPTYGDATVNGFSITQEKTFARRNLGIAMQDDIIWVSENHNFPTFIFLICFFLRTMSMWKII